MSNAILIKKELNGLKDSKQAANLQRFFKTGKGQYGQGDVFLGIKVPIQRKVVGQHLDISLAEAAKLLKSKIHEERLVALLILVKQFEKADKVKRNKIFNLYLKSTKWINNWDLVDLSAPNIVGTYLLAKPRKILYELAKSKSLWERRIAILATLSFIRQNDFKDALKIAEILIFDEHDLIHKAVGWMLREIGKRDQVKEEEFLEKNYKIMPRTMLRYSIERFSEAKRKYYLAK